MEFISTRRNIRKINFQEVALKGLSEDGGLYIPNNWKDIRNTYTDTNYSFQETAFHILKNFVGPNLNDKVLRLLIKNSYKNFSHNDITPLKKLDNNNYLLELFHGPTLAFKDIALQFLGNIFELYLSKSNKKLTVIGATSGDTGSAAIEAVKKNKYSEIFILHPYNRVSEFQRRQMTTIISDNVHNIAIKGNFDDCQNIIKKLFGDIELNNKLRLGSINSINWARIMAQITYYIYAYNKIKNMNLGNKINFSVPTGNFGDAYAGYIAKKRFSIPIKKIIIATNKNNILDRFFRTGIYKREKVYKTKSPSMDIQVASNFERLLYDINNSNGDKVNKLMNLFNKNKKIILDTSVFKNTKKDFFSFSVSEERTSKSMIRAYEKYNLVIDPHTAVGLEAAKEFLRKNKNDIVITVGTAHPIKFSDAVKSALGFSPDLPKKFKKIFSLEEKYKVLDNSFEDVRNYILKNT